MTTIITPHVRVGRLALTLLVTLPYALGWLIGASITACTWAVSALLVGYRDGRQGRGAGRRRDDQQVS